MGQSRNSVKFASPTHHRYSAASDNIGDILVMMHSQKSLVKIGRKKQIRHFPETKSEVEQKHKQIWAAIGTLRFGNRDFKTSSGRSL